MKQKEVYRLRYSFFDLLRAWTIRQSNRLTWGWLHIRWLLIWVRSNSTQNSKARSNSTQNSKAIPNSTQNSKGSSREECLKSLKGARYPYSNSTHPSRPGINWSVNMGGPTSNGKAPIACSIWVRPNWPQKLAQRGSNV